MAEPISRSSRRIPALEEATFPQPCQGTRPVEEKIHAVRSSLPSIEPSEGQNQPKEIEALCQQLEGLQLSARQNIVFPSEDTIDWNEMLGNWCVQSGDQSQYFVRFRDGQSVPISEGQLNRLLRLLATYEQAEGDPAATIFRLKSPSGRSFLLKIAELVTYSDLEEHEEFHDNSFEHRVCSWLGAGFGGIAKVAMLLSAATVASATKVFPPSSGGALVPALPSCNPLANSVALADVCPLVNRFSCPIQPTCPVNYPLSSMPEEWTRQSLAQREPSFALALQFHNASFFQMSFVKAAMNNQAPLAQQLIEANVGVDINLVVPEKNSALVYAVFHGNAPFVEYLLQQGADLSLPDGWQCLPLVTSAQLQTPEIANLLIAYGAEVNRVIPGKATPLVWAISKNNKPLVEYLLQQGADPELLSGEGVSPLGSTTQSTSPDLVDLLVQKGADINRVVPDQKTALTCAIGKGNLPVVKYFLEHGGNPNLPDGFGGNPLFRATQSTETEVAIDLVKVLTESGALIDNAVKGWRNALTNAVYGGDLPLVESLLTSFGADPNGFDGTGMPPLMWAEASQHPSKENILSSLFHSGANETTSLLYRSMKMAAHCWTVGGDVEVQTTTGRRDFPLEGLNIDVAAPPLTDYFIRFIPDGPKFLQKFLSIQPQLKLDEISKFMPYGPLLSQTELEVIHDTLEQMVPRVPFSPQKIVQRIQTGRPFFWLKTFRQQSHAIALVFQNNHLYVCNRSPGPGHAGIYEYDVDKDRLDTNFFQQIEETTDLSKLSSFLSQAGALLQESLVQSNQKIGNCAWASAKSGFRALLDSVFRESGATEEERWARAKAIYKSFTTFTRVQSLDDYLDACGSLPPNREFLEKIRNKIINAHEGRFDHETKERLLKKVDAALGANASASH